MTPLGKRCAEKGVLLMNLNDPVVKVDTYEGME